MPLFIHKHQPVEARQFFSPVSTELKAFCPYLDDFQADKGSTVKAAIWPGSYREPSNPLYYVREGDWLVKDPASCVDCYPLSDSELRRMFNPFYDPDT